MAEERDSPTYIGRHPTCGHIRLAIVDDEPGDPMVARWVAGGIRDGLVVNRETSSVVRAEGVGSCATCDPKGAELRARRAAGQQLALGIR